MFLFPLADVQGMDWKAMAQEAVTMHAEQDIDLKKAVSIVAKQKKLTEGQAAQVSAATGPIIRALNAVKKKEAKDQKAQRDAKKVKPAETKPAEPPVVKVKEPVKPEVKEPVKLDGHPDTEPDQGGDTHTAMEGAEALVKPAIMHAKQTLVRKIEAEFDAVMEKILLDDYRRALFAVWRKEHGFEGDLGDFLIDAFDEFMKRRGVDFEYVERIPVIRR